MTILSTTRKTIAHALMKRRASNAANDASTSELFSRIKGRELPALSNEEKASINKLYGDLDVKIDYRYWQLYKSEGMFSATMLADDIYVSRILRILNPIKFASPLQNKNIYPLLYRNIPQPETLVNCMNGIMRNVDGKTISLDQAVVILIQSQDIIIKASKGSCGGKGVQRFCFSESDDPKTIHNILVSYGDFFVVQRCVKQSSLTGKFNKSSLNTFRINTLSLNGKTTVTNILFRHGKNGAVVDNGGSGGICCGVNCMGQFSGIAIDTKLNRYTTTAFGQSYADQMIPVMPTLCETAINAHNMYLPMMAHAAWDFALDENDQPVLIEVNLGWPGIMLEQIANAAPIYGDRMGEVVEYCKKRITSLHRNEFNGDWL